MVRLIRIAFGSDPDAADAISVETEENGLRAAATLEIETRVRDALRAVAVLARVVASTLVKGAAPVVEIARKASGA